MNKLIRNNFRRRGLATVEAALVFPLMFVLTFAAVEYGWMFLKQQQLTNAARQGARMAATPFVTNGDVSARVSTMMNDYDLGSSGYSVTFSPGNIASPAPGSTVSVQISVNYSNITITDMGLFPVPATLSATVVMAKEGP